MPNHIIFTRKYNGFKQAIGNNVLSELEPKRVSTRPYPAARLVSKNEIYDVAIDEVFEDDVEYLMTVSILASNDFSADRIIDLMLQTPSGYSLSLTCEVKWYLKGTPHNKKLILGMKVLTPTPKYKELLKNIN